MELLELFRQYYKHVYFVQDPGISVTEGYAPYDEGLKADIFIKNSSGQPIIGKVSIASYIIQ